MARLPSGMVTMLFSDIEGSTRLLEQLGTDAYADALEMHRRIVRAALDDHGGVEVGTHGDAFLCAFREAGDAVAAAAEIQRGHAAHRWPSGTVLRVRVGLHTGEPLLTGDNYVGLDVHRAARVMSAGHGGQVLLSEATAELVRDHLPRDVTLRDLGEHRLKDLSEPQRLQDLVIGGLDSRFPPLETLGRRPSNLPVAAHRLIGRERELSEITRGLGERETRLLTLTGPGGTGKTRLAMEAAAQLVETFDDGVFAVLLAAVRDPELVLPTIAQTLGLREQSGETIEATLSAYLASRRVLLVLDNLEQVVSAAPGVAAVLAAAPGVSIIATSREPLNISHERTYEVMPLPAPDDAEAMDARGHSSTTRSSSSSSAHEPRRLISPSPTRTPARWPRSALPWRDCRSRSSWQRRACASSRRTRSARGSTGRSAS